MTTPVDVIMPVVAGDVALATLAIDSARTMVAGLHELILVVPDTDVARFEALGLADRVVAENSIHRTLADVPRGWYKQQLVKLCTHLVARTDTVLVLDCDVITLRPVGDAQLFIDGRPKFFVEDPTGGVHPDWIAKAGAFLGIPSAGTPSYFPTPNLVHSSVLEALHRYIGARFGADPIAAMARRIGEFTEWATYGLFAAHGPASRRIHAFTTECHVTGLWSPEDAAAWDPPDSDAVPPFLIAHSWAPIDLLALGSRVERLTGPLPRVRGTERAALIPRGTTVTLTSCTGTVTRPLELERLVFRDDVVDRGRDRTVCRLRRDRWGSDLGGGTLAVDTRDLVWL